MRNLTCLCLIAVLFFSCSTQEEVIELTYPDGDPKLVVLYEKSGNDKLKLRETTYYDNGNKKYEGAFDEQGNRNGTWQYWYDTNQLWSECGYLGGKKHGKNVIYYQNGQKRYEGQYDNDQKTGIWRFWDAEGNLQTEVEY